MIKIFIITFYILLFNILKTEAQPLKWTKQIPDYFSNVSQMEMDTSGNFYILGSIDSASTTLPFIAKLNPSVTVEWYKTLNSSIECSTIKIDVHGNLFLVGSLIDSLKIDNKVFYSKGPQSGYLLGFSSNGEIISSKIIEGSGSISIQDIDFDSINNAYITGHFIDTLEMDSAVYHSNFQTTFLAKLSNNSLEWFRYSKGYYGDSNFSSGKQIKVNSVGNIFLQITGYGNIVFDTLETYNGCPSMNLFGVTFNNEGDAKWVGNMECYSFINEISSYKDNNFVTVGRYSYKTSSSEVFLYDISGNRSKIDWFDSNSEGASITVDLKNNIFFTGKYNEAYSEFGDTTKLYVKKGNDSKPFTYVRATEHSEGLDIVANNDGFLYVLGYFRGTLLTPDSLSSHLGNYFIAKLSDSIITNTQTYTNAASDKLKNNISNFTVYPNPSNSAFTVNYTVSNGREILLKVISATGECIYSKHYLDSNINIQEVIHLGERAKGIYLVKISDNNLSQTKKIIIY